MTKSVLPHLTDSPSATSRISADAGTMQLTLFAVGPWVSLGSIVTSREYGAAAFVVTASVVNASLLALYLRARSASVTSYVQATLFLTGMITALQVADIVTEPGPAFAIAVLLAFALMLPYGRLLEALRKRSRSEQHGEMRTVAPARKRPSGAQIVLLAVVLAWATLAATEYGGVLTFAVVAIGLQCVLLLWYLSASTVGIARTRCNVLFAAAVISDGLVLQAAGLAAGSTLVVGTVLFAVVGVAITGLDRVWRKRLRGTPGGRGAY